MPVAGNPFVTVNASGQTVITSAHQLQLIGYTPYSNGALLAGHYALGANIDLTQTSAAAAAAGSVWAPTGWVALGTDGAGNVWNGAGYAANATTGFTGMLKGPGYTINGLTISNGSANYQGLFGYAGLGSSLAYLTLAGVNVTGMNSTGGLAGRVNGTTASVRFDSVAGSVSGGTDVGGLLGYLQAGALTGSSSSATVAGTFYVGGLVGTVSTGSNTADGIGSVSNSYAGGAVGASGGCAGGLVGLANSGSTIGDVYASGAVTGQAGAFAIGGLIGSVGTGASVTSAWASGAVGGNDGGAGTIGGLVGYDLGTVSNGYWDSYSTGQAAAFGTGSGTNVAAVTSDPAQAAAANDAYKANAYANLTQGDALGTGAAAGFVFLTGDQTRPFLAVEVPLVGNPGIQTNAAGQVILTTSHQLQLVGYNATTLAGSYAMLRNLNLAETGAVMAGLPGSYAGMWSSAGFVPIGTDGAGNLLTGTGVVAPNFSTTVAGGFTGSLAGGGYAVSGLYENRTAALAGLFGASSGTIGNLSVAGTVTGGTGTGGLVGLQQGGSVTGVTSSVVVNGSSYVGGLIGEALGAARIAASSASGAVTATGAAGGLIGLLLNSTATGVSASGAVTGRNGRTGGLVGIIDGGAVTRASATGTANGQANTPYGQLANGGTYSSN